MPTAAYAQTTWHDTIDGPPITRDMDDWYVCSATSSDGTNFTNPKCRELDLHHDLYKSVVFGYSATAGYAEERFYRAWIVVPRDDVDGHRMIIQSYTLICDYLLSEGPAHSNVLAQYRTSWNSALTRVRSPDTAIFQSNASGRQAITVTWTSGVNNWYVHTPDTITYQIQIDSKSVVVGRVAESSVICFLQNIEGQDWVPVVTPVPTGVPSPTPTLICYIGCGPGWEVPVLTRTPLTTTPFNPIETDIELDVGTPSSPVCNTVVPAAEDIGWNSINLATALDGLGLGDRAWEGLEVCVRQRSFALVFLDINWGAYLLAAFGLMGIGAVISWFKSGG